MCGRRVVWCGELVVAMKILSVNIRGLGAAEKKREVRRLVLERKPMVLCIQESKLEVVSEALCRSLWGSGPMAFSFKRSVGASGGIITVWDSSVLDVWVTVNIVNCLIVKGRFLKNSELFCLANTYAPCDIRGRQDLWDVLSNLIQVHDEAAWCILGDFNVVGLVKKEEGERIILLMVIMLLLISSLTVTFLLIYLYVVVILPGIEEMVCL